MVVSANYNYLVLVRDFACVCADIAARPIYLYAILIMEKLKTVFAAVLGMSVENIHDDLSPDNCPAWDSLNAIILITEIEKAFGVKFTFDEAMAVKNFGDATKLVESKGGKSHE